ncbi:MAG TPA: DJ-1/PfpI family protein [Ignavibacteriaceae bacterium]|nr:DJ-1/PfpI family protein [Ignavibacteriaceae bacterium]
MIIKRSILLFIPGKDFSEVEYFTIRDYLQKRGVNVFITSDANNLCTGDNGFKVKSEVSFFNINENNFSGIVLIGGSGASIYFDNKVLHKLLIRFYSKKKIIAAICTAPLILGKAGLLVETPATSHNSVKQEMLFSRCNFKDFPVVIHNNIITANGPGAAVDFASAILNMMERK